MQRFREWVCSIAWRILWRWWPDRHYVWGNPGRYDGHLTETVDLDTARWAAFDGMHVRERLDHAGRPVEPHHIPGYQTRKGQPPIRIY